MGRFLQANIANEIPQLDELDLKGKRNENSKIKEMYAETDGKKLFTGLHLNCFFIIGLYF